MEHAVSAGAVPVETNFRCRMGEIDLIYIDEGYLVFAEVKFRSGDRFGSALEAVGKSKMRTICRVGEYYRMTHKRYAGSPVRYDVFALEPDENGSLRINWLKDAFEHIY